MYLVPGVYLVWGVYLVPGVYLVQGGGYLVWRVYLVPGELPSPGGCTWFWGGVPGPGGLPGPRGVYLVQGIPAGGVPAQVLPPWPGQVLPSVDRQMPVNLLPCPKLRLRAVIT